MNNPSWAVSQVAGWLSTNTNSLSPQFKECLDVTVRLAQAALAMAEHQAEIQDIRKGG